MIFGIDSMYIWVAVIILCVAIEAFSLDLASIWFGAGGVAALIAASIGLGVPAQFVIFILFSAVLLILARPFCLKFLRTKAEPTNADRIIGEAAIVVEDIDNMQETGEIKVFGQLWTARSADDAPIPKGAAVKVIAIRGVKAIVERAM